MAYYHTYRPKQFGELVGQDHIRLTLQNALATGGLVHAYLFSGPKGSGKTTTARLLARSVNCLKVHGQQSTVHGNHDPSSVDRSQSTIIEPCNKCDSCQNIINGKSLDIIEIDAASNRGIDEIRNLKERLMYPPANARKKVYIIDEIHMLTREAFNALLKTLEEPPSHIMFIFATTEPHRLPETILSRVQKFDFHRASDQHMIGWLKMIASSEKVEITDDALSMIVERSGGAFRDAAVILEQVAGQGIFPIQQDTIAHVLGFSPRATVQWIADGILAGDGQNILTELDRLYGQGVDCVELLRQLVDNLRHRLRQTWSSEIITALNALLKAQVAIRYSPIPQLPLELAIIEVTKQLSSMDIAKDLKKAKKGDLKTSTISSQGKKDDLASNMKTELRTGQTVDQTIWVKAVDQLKLYNHSLAGILTLAKPQLFDGQGRLNLTVPFKFHKARIMDIRNKKAIETSLEKAFGQSLTIECIIDPNMQTVSHVKDDQENELAETAEMMFQN